jgi:alpha-N-acetylgalactosaminidase
LTYPHMNAKTVSFLLVLLIIFKIAVASNNGLARTPPMGWMSWERFRCNTDCANYPDTCISENLFIQMADIIVRDGYQNVGYQYVSIDDCWLSKYRDSKGRLQPDPVRFPRGIKYLADYVHSKGLKLGIYEDFGNYTCAGYPGSQYFIDIDAHTFATWGVDYLKLDACNSEVDDQPAGYVAMALALNRTNRPIVFSCSLPVYQIIAGRQVNWTLVTEICNLWRMYYDIQDSWDSVMSIANYYAENADMLRSHAGPGHWNDPDMLIIGDFSLSIEEAKAQMALWSIWAAPLLMSNDLRTISSEYRAILQNREVIAVDQDPLGIQAKLLFHQNGWQIWYRPLATGEVAVVFFNSNSDGMPSPISLKFSSVGIKANKAKVRDLFLHKDLGVYSQKFETMVNPHGVVMVKITPSA